MSDDLRHRAATWIVNFLAARDEHRLKKVGTLLDGSAQGARCFVEDHAGLREELEAWRERTETAEHRIALARERLDALIAAGFGATTDTLRDLRAALDTKEET